MLRGRLYRRKGASGKRSKVWWGRIRFKQKEYNRSLDTEAKAIARQRLIKWSEELEKASWGEKPRRTLREAIEKFGDDYFPTLKRRSAERYVNSLTHIIRHMPDAYLEDVGSGLLAEFETARRREGVKAPTIRRDLSALSSVFTRAMVWEWTQHNPVRVYLSAKETNLKESEPRTRYLSHDEEKQIIARVAPSTRRMVIFAIDTGLRKEEMLALLRTDVDLQRREVTVRGVTSKNKKTRRVPLLPRTYAILREMMAEQPRSLYLFHRADGHRISEKTRNLRRDLIKAAKRSGIDEHLTWHDLRRTCATRLIQDYKMPLHEVSAWVGHGDVKLTAKRYAFLGADALHERIAEAPQLSATTLRLVKGE